MIVQSFILYFMPLNFPVRFMFPRPFHHSFT